MRRILFACVANAMRSQMAEGLARHLAKPGTVEVRSGGTDPAGYVHPAAIRAMDERGIDIRGQVSKALDVEFGLQADASVTLCGPMDSACPRPLAKKALDWAQPDPSGGGDALVRRVRDDIERRIIALFREWGCLREDAVGRPR